MQDPADMAPTAHRDEPNGAEIMLSRSLFTTAAVVLAVTITAASVRPPTARAGSPPCRVVNARTEERYTGYGVNLQRAIDDAERRDRLIVQGMCAGSFTVERPLTLAGRPNQRFPTPTLDAKGDGHVLEISRGARIRSLRITGGRATSGGGIRLLVGRLVLEGKTAIVGNRASSGGGISTGEEGRLVLGGHATVRGNVSKFGGGISSNIPGSMLMKGRSAVLGNRARDTGGGIVLNVGSLTMADRASIRLNIARDFGGGIANLDGFVKLRDAARIVHNSAGREGGGVYNYFSQMLVCSPHVVLSPNDPDDAPDIEVGC